MEKEWGRKRLKEVGKFISYEKLHFFRDDGRRRHFAS
jgi:hypothetical protein